MLRAMLSTGVVRRLTGVLRRPVLKDTGYVLGAQLWSKGVAYLIAICMAQFLSVRGFSTYNFFLLTTTVLGGYIGLGLPVAAGKLIARGETDRRLGEHLSAVLVLAAGATVVALATAPLYLPVLLSDELPLSGVWIVAGAVVSTWSGLGQAMLYAVRAFRQALGPIIAGSAVFIAGAVWSAAAADVRPLLAGAVLSPVISGAGFASVFSRHPVFPGRLALPRPSRRAVGEVLAIALPGVGIGVIFTSLNWLVGRSLLEHQRAPVEFATFMIGLQWFALVLFVPLALGQAVFPRYVAMAHADRVPLRTVLLPVGTTAAILVALAPVGALAAPVLRWVYGGHYPFSPWYVAGVLLVAAVTGAQNLLSLFVIAVRGTGTWLAGSLAMVSTCVAVLAAWPPTTASGALAVMGLCYGGLLAVALAIVVREAVRGPVPAMGTTP